MINGRGVLVNINRALILAILVMAVVNIWLSQPESVQYLSDIQPMLVTQIHGGVTAGSTYWGTPIELRNVPYPRSISTHPELVEGFVRYDASGFARLDATIGLHKSETGLVQFSVGTNRSGQRLRRETLSGKAEALDVFIPLQNATTVELYVDPLEDNREDHAVWVNARLVKEQIAAGDAPYLVFLFGVFSAFILLHIRRESLVELTVFMVVLLAVCYVLSKQVAPGFPWVH